MFTLLTCYFVNNTLVKSSYSVVNQIKAQDSVVSCQAINEVGMGEMERKTITALTGEACPSAAGATLIIIIIVILLIIFGLIAVFILYRKNLLCFAGMIL